MREGGAEVITAENCALVLSISMALSPSELSPNTAGPQGHRGYAALLIQEPLGLLGAKQSPR